LNGKHFESLGKLVLENGRQLILITVACLFAACSSGSDGGSPPPPPPPPPPPAAPVANAGVDRTVGELTVINLSGSATDVNNDPITYSWMQTGGTAVTINTPDAAMASFTSPDVVLGNPEVLTFELTASDPGGLSSTDMIDITVQEDPPPPVSVTISGILSFEFPPPNNNCNGLNFSAIQVRPIREATVQLLDSTGMTLLDSLVSGSDGAYSFTLDSGTDFIIRVRAELKNAAWDVEVRNNVDMSASPPALELRPIYVMDQPFNSGAADDPNKNLIATTGWGTTSYTGARVAAPFAILDTIYTAIQFVAATDPGANFGPLDAFWSPDNTATIGEPQDIETGELGTSFYRGDINSLFLLGMDGVDTEEFDDHVISHEWSHYFEDNFSRSDSIGGGHFIGRDALDMRVAFGEGFADAMSAMTMGDPIYCDTSWFGSNQSGFAVNMEESNTNNEGWFDEVSVFEIIYDLWDTTNEGGADTSSIGFGPIYDVMTGPQVTSPAFTSIFSFATILKQQNPGQAAFIDALLTDHNMTSNIDIYGDSELNDGPGTPPDVLPIYSDIALGVTTNICVNSQFDNDRDGNKLSEHRYLRFNVPTGGVVTFSMIATSADGNTPSQPAPGFDCVAAFDADPDDPAVHEHSDPDFLVWQNERLAEVGFGCEPNGETTAGRFLQAGDYVVDINDFRHADNHPTVPAGYPERVCFDFTAN